MTKDKGRRDSAPLSASGSPAKLTIALAQVPFGASIEDTVAEAASGGAEVVLFPETFSNGYPSVQTEGEMTAWRATAEDPATGRAATGYSQAAADHHVHVVGTLLVREGERLHNTAVLFGPDGAPLLTQHKRITCHFGRPESALTPGSASHIAQIITRAGPLTVGLMICMDREGAAPAQDLARAGAEVILVPNACPMITDPEVGDVRTAGLRGTAFNHAVAVALANYPAPAQDGGSLFIDAKGQIVTQAGPEPGVILAQLDLTQLKTTRQAEWFRWSDAP